jgi:signal peptidase I
MKDKELYVNGEKLPTRSEGRYEYEDTSGVKVDAELLIETIGDVEHKILLTDSFRSPLDNFRRVVPENQYFCMGDNRDRSNDSRYWGFVDASLIRGKAMVIYFSWPPTQWLRIGSLTR